MKMRSELFYDNIFILKMEIESTMKIYGIYFSYVKKYLHSFRYDHYDNCITRFAMSFEPHFIRIQF